MSYKVIYSEFVPIKSNRKYNDGRFRSAIAMWLLILTVIVRVFWQEGTEVLRKWLLPDALTCAEAAFYALLEDLRCVISAADSIASFCLKIIHEPY